MEATFEGRQEASRAGAVSCGTQAVRPHCPWAMTIRTQAPGPPPTNCHRRITTTCGVVAAMNSQGSLQVVTLLFSHPLFVLLWSGGGTPRPLLYRNHKHRVLQSPILVVALEKACPKKSGKYRDPPPTNALGTGMFCVLDKGLQLQHPNGAKASDPGLQSDTKRTSTKVTGVSAHSTCTQTSNSITQTQHRHTNQQQSHTPSPTTHPEPPS